MCNSHLCMCELIFFLIIIQLYHILKACWCQLHFIHSVRENKYIVCVCSVHFCFQFVLLGLCFCLSNEVCLCTTKDCNLKALFQNLAIFQGIILKLLMQKLSEILLNRKNHPPWLYHWEKKILTVNLHHGCLINPIIL